jgi:sugar/nucleoside kinase (ribokinase family)
MNFWISGKLESLLQVIARSQIIILNDEEIRQLTGCINLIQGGEKILEMGPQVVIIKKGEHGAMMMHGNSYFIAPAFPVTHVVDPTGAGDSFAGGFVGYLARNGRFSDAEIRKAVVHGNVLASFTVEDFSFNRLNSLTTEELDARMQAFRRIIHY